jgi:hypothetical protein
LPCRTASRNIRIWTTSIKASDGCQHRHRQNITQKIMKKNGMHRIDIMCTFGEICSDWSQLRIVKYISPRMTARTFHHAVAVCARGLLGVHDACLAGPWELCTQGVSVIAGPPG